MRSLRSIRARKMGHTWLTYRRPPAKSGDEQDWICKRWRRWLYWKPGEGKRIKRGMNRRARREAKRALTLLEVLENGC